MKNHPIIRSGLPLPLPRPAHRKAPRTPRKSSGPEVLESRIAPAATLGVTKVAVFAPGGDLNSNGLFDPGDTILYSVTLTNTGTVDLTGVTFNDILDGNLTQGAVNASPLAFDDTFSAVANTLLEVGVTHGAFPAAQVAGSVTANDAEFLGDTFTLTKLGGTNLSGGTASGTSTNGGSVTLNSTGNFTYLPAAGFTGTDTFTYTIADKGFDGIAGNADDLSSVGTVTITVGAQKVWYVDNSYTGVNGASDGRSTRPFTSITATNLNGPGGVGDVDGAGDIIYIHNGTGSAYTGGIALEGNQTLHGQGEILQVGGFTLNAAGTAPKLTNVGGTVVALSNAASNVNTIKGLTIGDSNIDISGSSFGTLNITNTVSLNGTGKALDLTTGTISATLADLTVTSSATEGIKLTGVNGTLTANSGSLAGIAGDDIFISGGTATITLGLSDTNTAGHSVNIASKTGGTVNLNGSINDTGTGILLSSNTGATIHFTGGIVASTTTNKAFSATGGGTIDVTGANNTLTTTTGTALEVQNTTISGTGLLFKSISANGGANGIFLNNTGAGGLTITGNGTTAGSGGTITNTTGDGVHIQTGTGPISLSNLNLTANAKTQTVVANNDLTVATITSNVANLYLNSVGSVSLTNLSVTGSTQQGILAIGVTGLSLANSTISGNGNQDYEDGLLLKNVTGTVTLTGNSIVDNFSRQAHVYNDSGTANWTVTGTTFGRTVAPGVSSQQAFLWQLALTSQGNIDIGTSSFTNSGNGNGLQINLTDSAKLGSAGAHSSVHNSVSMTNNAAHVFVNTSTGSTATAFFDVMNNLVMTNAILQAVDYFAPGGTLTGIIQGNTIGTSGVANSGSTGDGMTIDATNNGVLNLRIQSNTIQQVVTNGIAMGTTQTATLAASILSNTIRQPSGGANQGNAMLFNVGANSGSTTQAYLTITGNTITDTASNSWDINGSGAAIYFNTKNATVTNLPGYAGGATNDANFQNTVNGNNTITLVFPGAAKTLVTRFNGSTFGGASSPLPAPLLFAPEPGDVVVVTPPAEDGGTPVVTPPAGGGDTTPVVTPPTATQPVIVDDGILSQAELDSLVAAAIARWEAAGITPAQDALLHNVTFSVADLPGWELGAASAGHVTLDVSAAGNSWFIDATPNDDSEFSGTGTQLAAKTAGGAAGRIDALTTIVHELGHQLGLDDSYNGTDAANLMYGFIHQGERRLPGLHQADGATPHLAAGGLDFAIGPVNIGSLPIGKSVQVQFKGTIHTNIAVNSVSNTGTGHSTETGDVSSNTVVTSVDLPDVSVTVAPASVAEDSGTGIVYTFTRTGPNDFARTINFSVTGTGTFGSDYTQSGAASFTTTTGTVTFAAGSATATVTITPTADTTVEADETAILTVTAGTGYDVGSPAGATSTIVNDDTSISVAVAPASVSEDGAGNLTYTFTRAGVTTGALTVNFSVGGNAAFGTDYAQSGAATFGASAGTVTFAPGATTATITIDPTADNVVETDETAVLTVTAGTGYNTITGSPATGTITNDDSDVSIGVAPTSVVEDGAGNLTYTFTRTGFLGNALAVNYQASGTASFVAAGNDYTVTGGAAGSSFSNTTGAGVLVFAAGSATATLTVDPTADTNVEPNETVVLTLTANGAPAVTGGYSLGATTAATGTINDDDASLHADITGGNLTVTDISAAGQNDNLTFKIVGANLEISDTTNVWDGVPTTVPASTLSNGGKTITIPLSAYTGGLTINTLGGTDTATLDLSAGNFIHAAGVDFNGGNPTVTPGDKLVISGGAQGTVTYNFTNASDGSIVMSNFGTVRYTGLEPITNTGTATDVILNLPATSDTVFLEDNGATPADGLLRLRSAPTSFEQTDFAIPSNSLTINLGAGSDALTLSATPQLTAGLTINGGIGDDTISLNSSITFAANKNLNIDLQDDDPTPGIDVINMSSAGNYVLSGTGAAVFKASKNIQIGGHLATVDGAITLEANQQAVATTGNFVGVNVLGTSVVENTGTGVINILGKGGNDGAGGQTGFRTNTGALVRGGTTGDAVTIVGVGGASSGVGVFIPNGAVRSLGGNILLTGTGTGVSSGSGSGGVTIQNSGVVAPGLNGSVIIDATSASPSANAFTLFTVAANPTGVFTTGTGSITIIADSASIDTANAFSFLDAGATGTVTIRPKTNGTAVNVGSTNAGPTAGVLELSDAELDRVVAGTVQIGNGNSGAITITDVISPATYQTLSIGKAASFTATGGFASDVTSGTVYEKMVVAGAVTIDPAAALTVTAVGGYVPTTSDAFTILNNTSASTTTGTFAGKPEGTTVVVGGTNEKITYIGGAGNNDVILQGTTVGVTIGTTPVLESSATGLVYTFTRTGDTSVALPISFAKSGTATATADYTATSSAATFDFAAGTLTIPAGVASVTVTLTPVDDRLVEGNETATLTVTNAAGYGAAGSPATGTITDNDTATIGFTTGTSTGLESIGTQNISATLTINAIGTGTIGLASDLTANLTTTGGTATGGGTDYTLPGTPAITFLAGTYATGTGIQNAALAVTDDRLVEGDETAALGLAIVQNIGTQVSVGGTTAHTLTITDNDTATIGFTAGTSTALESIGTQNISATLTINAIGTGTIGLASNLTANLTTTGGTATGGGTDYTLPGTPAITFLAGTYAGGTGTQTAAVAVTDDRLVEGSETAALGLAIAQNIGTQASVGGTTAHTLTITDNDTATIGFTAGTSTALESIGTQNISATLTINAIGTGTIGLASNLTANLTTTGGTATGSGTDYTLPGSPAVTFLAGTYATGTGTQTAALTVTDDRLVEGDETAALGLAIAQNIGTQVSVGGTTTHTLTITDNDTATIGFTTGASSTSEGVGTQSVSATLTINAIGTGTIGLASNLTANLTSSGGTATGGGTDYTLPGSPAVTFLAGTYAGGTGTQNASVPITDDRAVEGSETAALGLAIAQNIGTQVSVGGTTTHTLTITDNDTATIGFLAATSTKGEGAGTDALTAVLTVSAIGTGPITLARNVTVNLSGTGTATSTADYTLPGTINFLAGDADGAQHSVNLAIVDDFRVEGNETVQATLAMGTDGTGGAVSVAPATASHTTTITDNDTAKVQYVTATSNSAEGGSPVTLTAVLSLQVTGTGGPIGLDRDVTVGFTATGGTATAADFVLPGSVTFPAGSLAGDTKSANLTIVDDALVEGTETAVLGLSIVSDGTGGQASVLAGTSHTTTITDNDVDLTITKTDGVTSAVPGATVTYTITVSNPSPTSTTGAHVTDLFPANLTGVTWTSVGAGGGSGTPNGLGDINDTVNLPSGGSVTYTVTGTVLASVTGSLSNTATVAAGAGFTDQVLGNNSATDTDTLTPQGDLSITKTDGIASLVPGMQDTYTIVVSNNGPSNVIGASVTDLFPAGFNNITYTANGTAGTVFTANGSGNLADTVNIPAGGSITYTVHGTTASSLTGSFSNSATVTAPGGFTETNPGNNTAADTDTLTPQADVSILKTGPANAVAGSDITYHITVTNSGPSDAQMVNISDLLPNGTSLVSFNQTGGPGVGGTLPSGGTETFDLVVHVNSSVTAGTILSNRADVSTATTDFNSENNTSFATSTVVTQADLSLTKTDSPDPVNVGSNLTYTITLHNNGSSDAQNVSITDAIPAGFTFVSLSTPGGWSATTPAVGANGTVTLTKTTVTNGEDDVFLLVVTPSANTGGQDITNTATVTSTTTDLVAANNTATATTTVAGVDLTLTKTDNLTSTTPNSTLTYALNYSNAGFVDATGVVLTETLPTGTHFVAGDNPGWTQVGATNQYTYAVGTVAIGGTGSVNFVVHTNAAAPAGLETIDNSASIGDDSTHGTDINPTNNSTTDSDTLNAAPDLSVTISDAPTTAVRGGSVVYTLTYSNVGNQDSTGAFLTATLPANTSFDFGTSTGGWVFQSGNTYKLSIGNLAAGDGNHTATFGVKVNTTLPGGYNQLSTTGSITDDLANGTDPVTANNSATELTTIYQGIYVVSPGVSLPGRAAPPAIRVFDIATGVETDINAYESTYRNSIRVATGDINGDGYDDIITSTITGNGRIRVFDGKTGARFTGAFSELAAFTERGARGAYVASGDVNGDGRDDIIVGSGYAAGGVAQVKVFSGVDGSLLSFANNTPFGTRFHGGIRVASGDVNGDGIADIIASQGFGGNEVIVTRGHSTNQDRVVANDTLLDLHIGGTRYKGGLFVASAADLNADGKADLVIGRDRGPTVVETYSGATGGLLHSITPFAPRYALGARVAAADVNLDGIADIIVGSGGRNGGQVKFFDGVTNTEITSKAFVAFPSFPVGALFVAGTSPVPSIKPNILT